MARVSPTICSPIPWVRPPEPFPPEKGEICTNHPKFLDKKLAETDLAMSH